MGGLTRKPFYNFKNFVLFSIDSIFCLLIGLITQVNSCLFIKYDNYTSSIKLQSYALIIYCKDFEVIGCLYVFHRLYFWKVLITKYVFYNWVIFIYLYNPPIIKFKRIIQLSTNLLIKTPNLSNHKDYLFTHHESW